MNSFAKQLLLAASVFSLAKAEQDDHSSMDMAEHASHDPEDMVHHLEESAQRIVENVDKVYLLMSNPDAGSIDYVQVKETHVDGVAHGCLTADVEGVNRLVAGLEYPTYIHYDWKLEHLYVCDVNKIIAYEIQWGADHDNFVDGEGTVLVHDIECGGLSTDKWGNLHFVDKKSEGIMRVMTVDIEDYQAQQGEHISRQHLYAAATTQTATNLEDITIEREYLYWSQSGEKLANLNKHGAIHKAFTEPFVNATPFQSYEDYEVARARSIETNNHYLFFTGFKRKDEVDRLFIQKKNGAGFYTEYSQEDTEHLNRPDAILAYKETLLLVANQGFISQMDLRSFPPNADDFYPNHVVELNGRTSAPKGLAFMSEMPLTVNRNGALAGVTTALVSAASLFYLTF